MYGNFVALLIFVLFFPSVRAWRRGLWPFLVAVDLGAVVRVFVTGRLGSCIAKGAESPGKRGAGARAGSLLSWAGHLAGGAWHPCWGAGAWLRVGFQAEFVVLALTSVSNSNISGKTHHVHQLILDQAQQSLNTLSGDVASLLERSSVSVRTSFFWEGQQDALKWRLETVARAVLV